MSNVERWVTLAGVVILVIAVAIGLSGCAMTPEQRIATCQTYDQLITVALTLEPTPEREQRIQHYRTLKALAGCVLEPPE